MPPKKILAKPPPQVKKKPAASKAMEDDCDLESDDEQDGEETVLLESHGDEVDIQQLMRDMRNAVSKSKMDRV